jgi:hypothetical protein
MKKLLVMFIFFAFAIVVPLEVKVMPTGDVYIVADVDADTQQADSTGKDEQRQNEPLERKKPTESNWKINVLPRPDNIKSPIERREDQFHLPPDRF